MEIPSHLLMTHKLLTKYGFNLKSKYGKETRRIIKFDLIEQSLYLAYKLPSSEMWHYITPAMAKSFKDRENQRSLLSFSNSLSPPERTALVSETWLRQKSAEGLKTDLKHGHGLELIYKNRPLNSKGEEVVGGGVAILYDPEKIHLREHKLKKS